MVSAPSSSPGCRRARLPRGGPRRVSASAFSSLAADLASGLAPPDAPAVVDPAHWTRYAFMFPVSVGVATTAMLTGIGGAALFTPIFLLGFPLLGPEFALESPAEAFNVALITECFGFTSGLIGYARRGLVDWRVAAPFAAVGVPFAVVGGVRVADADPAALRIAYGAAMLVLAATLVVEAKPEASEPPEASEASANDATKTSSAATILVTKTDASGRTYRYRRPPLDGLFFALTATGALATGLLSVGIGESVVPQLTRRGDATAIEEEGEEGGDSVDARGGARGMPLPVAAGTSVSVVIVVALCAAAAQASAVYGFGVGGGGEGGGIEAAERAFAFPTHLVCYTVPGVVCGGQIGPRLQGRVERRAAERAVGGVFACVGAAFLLAGARALPGGELVK